MITLTKEEQSKVLGGDQGVQIDDAVAALDANPYG